MNGSFVEKLEETEGKEQEFLSFGLHIKPLAQHLQDPLSLLQ